MTISGKTRLYAVAGNPVTHSLSPLIHNFLFQLFKVDAVYVALSVDVAAFLPLIKSLASTSFDGINITTPHKTGLIGRASFLTLEEVAEELSAVNTLKRVGQNWEGHNTDGAGLCDYIENECKMPVDGCKVTVLGAGPAAMAAVLELHKRGGAVSVLNRGKERFLHPFWQKLIGRGDIVTASSHNNDQCEQILGKAKIIVNGTGYGQGGKETELSFPWVLDSFEPSLVIDMNYGTKKMTPFLKLFKNTINCFSGRGMLRRQACRAFTIWTGIEVSEEVQKSLELYMASY